MSVKVATAGENIPSSDNPYAEFQAGVTATLRSWSALRTAVEQSWGGAESAAKADDLRSNIFTFFDGSVSSKPKMSQEELEDNLLGYMEEEFGVVLEDESEREVADLIWRMYELCGRGDVRLAREVVQNAIRAEDAIRQSNVKSVIKSEDDDDMEEDDDSDVEEEETGNSSVPQQQQQLMQANNNMAQTYASGNLFEDPSKPKKVATLPPPRQLGEAEPEKSQPVVDDDGFAPVVTKKKGKKR